MESGNGSSIDSQEEVLSWISWFCSIQGHEYFCEVAEEFIEDEFNLTGLNSLVKNYDRAIDIILDAEMDDQYEETDGKVHEQAENLYGMIHQRYIITRQGLQMMESKYNNGDFGVCQRDLCYAAHLLPCGLSDTMGVSTVKLFCPSCCDVYNPPSSRFNTVDGAFFGTTFPNLFMMTFQDIIHDAEPPGMIQLFYEERIFGFKVNSKAVSGAKMKWLRRYVRPEDHPSKRRPASENESDMEEEEEEEEVMGEKEQISEVAQIMDSQQSRVDSNAMDVDSPHQATARLTLGSDSATSINPLKVPGGDQNGN